MKTRTKIIMGLVLIAVIAVIGLQFTGNATAEPGKYDEFAKCVTESGAKMYGAYWCPHCDDQKKMFGDSFKYVDYIECDPRGNNANPAACEEAGIQGYPTWIFANGEEVGGAAPLRELAFRTECELPAE